MMDKIQRTCQSEERVENISVSNDGDLFYMEDRLKLMSAIETIIEDLILSLSRNEAPKLTFKVLKSFSDDNAIDFIKSSSRKKFSVVLYVLGKIFQLLARDKITTKRELYYENVKHFQNQSDISRALCDICRLLNVPIWQLRIQGTAKGLIAGTVSLVLRSGQVIDGGTTGGTLIPQNVIDIIRISSPAKWVLLIEKDAAFQKLIQDGGLHRLGQCIFVTGKGFPDINTRILVCLLQAHLRIPILALVDADPHGIEIMCTYRFGSKAMSSHSNALACRTIRWLGVHPSDIFRLGIENQPLTHEDKHKLRKMLQRPSIMSETKVRDQIKRLLEGGVKAEMEGVVKFSSTYLAESYIPNKITYKEYI